MLLRIQAFGDLLSHYGRIFSAAWAVRGEMATPTRMDHELAFLPATLELTDRPVHPAPRWTMLTLAAFAFLALVIAFVGQLDIVATARGKVVPTMRVKYVQPAVAGVVRAIHTADGQHVNSGDVLVELDPRQAESDQTKTHSSRISAALALARANALLEAQRSGSPPALSAVDGATDLEQSEARTLGLGVFREYQDKLSSAQANIRRKEAELETTQHQIEKLRATAPLARQQADDLAALVDRKYVTKAEYLDKQTNALQQEHELAAQLSHVKELDAALTAQRADLASYVSQFRREQLDAVEKARQQLTQSVEDEKKAQTRLGLMSLRAPSTGIVQQLSVHTVGGFVAGGQTLMEIVPDDTVEVEAVIENKDVGFVAVGQAATVKVEAFPYMRYGTLHGTVSHVSNDAVQDKRAGLGFMAKVRLDARDFVVNGQRIPLTPGMSVSAEIKTGKRNVLSYFLDPLMETSKESLRER